MENLHEYGERNGIKYRAAWNRFREGKIPGAFKTETGRILIPTHDDEIKNRCAIYARVSTHEQKDDLERQRQRLADFASARGWEIALEVSDIGSGVNDHRPKLQSLLAKKDSWGILLIEHRDRLTRVGFNYFDTLLSLMGKEIVVANSYSESDEGKVEDIYSLMYSFAVSEYGRRGARNRADRARKALDSPGEQ